MTVPAFAVWVDGRLSRPGEATVPFFDRGAHGGEGLFETFRVRRGRVFRWHRHLERLVLSAAELGFPVAPAPAALETALAEVVAANRIGGEAVARVTMTRGVPGGRPTRAGVWVEAEPLEARLWSGTRGQAARAVISRRPFVSGLLGRHKTLSRLAYQLCREEARAAGADEALLVDPDGRVLEGAASNVFLVAAGRLVTPAVTLPILPGIARAVVLEGARALGIPVEERDVDASELERAEELFLTNSVQEVVPVARLEDRDLPGRATGLRLAGYYRDTLERELGRP